MSSKPVIVQGSFNFDSPVGLVQERLTETGSVLPWIMVADGSPYFVTDQGSSYHVRAITGGKPFEA